MVRYGEGRGHGTVLYRNCDGGGGYTIFMTLTLMCIRYHHWRKRYMYGMISKLFFTAPCKSNYFKVSFKYILLIMLLQLTHFFLPLSPSTQQPPLSSCPWVIHISSLASPFPILFLTSHVYFVPTNYASYSLYLFHPFFHPFLLITLHVISISVILFLF